MKGSARFLGLCASLSAFWFGMTCLSALVAAILVGGPILAFLQVAVGFQMCFSISGALLRFYEGTGDLDANVSFRTALWFGFSEGLKGMMVDAFRAEQGLLFWYCVMSLLPNLPIVLASIFPPPAALLPAFFLEGLLALEFLSMVPLLVWFFPDFLERNRGVRAENTRRHVAGEPKLGLLTGLAAGWRAFTAFLPIYFRFFGNLLIVVPRYVFAFLRGRFYQTVDGDLLIVDQLLLRRNNRLECIRRNPLERPEHELPPEPVAEPLRRMQSEQERQAAFERDMAAAQEWLAAHERAMEDAEAELAAFKQKTVPDARAAMEAEDAMRLELQHRDRQFVELLGSVLVEFKGRDRDEKQDLEFQQQVGAFMKRMEAHYNSRREKRGADPTVQLNAQILKLSAYVFFLNLALQSNRETLRQSQAMGIPAGDYVDRTMGVSQAFFERFLKGVQLQNLQVLFTDPISKEFLSNPVILSSGQTVNESTAQRLYALGITQCPMSKKDLVKDGHQPDLTRKSLYDLFTTWGCFELLKEMVSQGASKLPDLDESIRSLCGVKESPAVSPKLEEKEALLNESPASQSPTPHNPRRAQPAYANALSRSRRSLSADFSDAGRREQSRSTPSPFG